MYGYAIRETTSTEGTGPIELDGAVGTGFFTFRDQFASGSKVVYVIASVGSDGNGDREIVEGTLTHGTPDTLTRDKVLESTNGGSKVNWGPGQKVVFCDFAADYTPADRTAESIASASTVNLGAAAGNFVHITGTTTITSFGTARVAGQRKTVVFDGELTLTHGASTIVLPGGANITTAAGDVAVMRADTTTKWVCESYTKASGRAVVDNDITLGTEQASTSGSAITFSSIPSGVKRITINFSAVSTNGTANIFIQLGDSGGLENTGYSAIGMRTANGTPPAVSAATSGFPIIVISASEALSGQITLALENAAAFRWTCQGQLAGHGTTQLYQTTGVKALSAELDRVAIVTTDTFDGGNINIVYER